MISKLIDGGFMKKLITIFFLTVSISAIARPVFLQPSCSSWNGECQVVNTSGEDISCTIYVNARTKMGRSLNATEYKILYTGMYAWVRVFNSNANDQVSYITGTASCSTLK